MSDNTWPKTTVFYLHGDKDTNYDKAKELGLSVEGTQNFLYAGYEVAITALVHEDGSVFATHLDTLSLSEPTRI